MLKPYSNILRSVYGGIFLNSKKTFRTHPILLIEGRLFGIIVVCVCGAMIYGITRLESLLGRITMSLLLLTFAGLAYFLRRILLDACWSKLTVYDDKAIWRCIFRKPVILYFSEVKYADTRVFDESEGNVVQDYYNTGRKYVLLSEKDLSGLGINKIRSAKGVIKFSHSKELAKVLKTRLPYPFKNRFQSN